MSSVTKKQKIIQEKLDPEKTYSISEAMEIIQLVKSEKFDESMILLANELCWPLDYVKSFKLNARKSNHKVTLSLS